MSADHEQPARGPYDGATPDRPPHSPNRRPVTLEPPEFVPLDAEHERQALDVLADMLASYLDDVQRSGVHEDSEAP